MYHQLCYHSALIIVLLNLYCYASPIDQNQYSHIMEPNVSITNSAIPSRQILNEIHRFKILCSFYGDCNDEDNRKIMDYDDTKHKHVSRLICFTVYQNLVNVHLHLHLLVYRNSVKSNDFFFEHKKEMDCIYISITVLVT
jgi:hypothetical protein